MTRIVLVSILVIDLLVACTEQYERKYYENGNLESKAKVRDGVYNGEFEKYFRNGKLKARGVWINGEGNGYIEYYYESGVVKERSNWKNKLQDGLTEIFYPDGKIEFRGSFREGLKVGEHVIFRKSGELSERTLYDENSNLYYLVKFANDEKQMELVMPVFEFESEDDSIKIAVKTEIDYDGLGILFLGIKQPNGEFKPVTNEIDVTSLAKVIRISKENFSELYYRFDFTPAESDSLASFGYEKRLIPQKDVPKQFDRTS